MRAPGCSRWTFVDRNRLADRVADHAPLARTPRRSEFSRIPGPRARYLRCSPDPALAPPAPRADTRGASSASPRCPRCAARAPLAPASPATSARGTRSRCARSDRSGRAPADGPAVAPGCRASGSLTRYGVAEISSAGSEVARITPSRSVIVPRCAGTDSSVTCCVRATLRSAALCNTPRYRVLPAASTSSAKNAANSNPTRCSGSPQCRQPPRPVAGYRRPQIGAQPPAGAASLAAAVSSPRYSWTSRRGRCLLRSWGSSSFRGSRARRRRAFAGRSGAFSRPRPPSVVADSFR